MYPTQNESNMNQLSAQKTLIQQSITDSLAFYKRK